MRAAISFSACAHVRHCNFLQALRRRPRANILRVSLLFEAEPCMLPSAMLVLAAQPLDPEVYCTACIRLVANLQDTQGLVPMLRSAVTLAKTTKPELGALDALAEEYVIERGCKWYATWNNLTIRKACLHITEEYGESLVEKITRWATKERSDLC